LLYLYRGTVLEWLPRLFSDVKILLLAKTQGLTEGIESFVNRLRGTGMHMPTHGRIRISLNGSTGFQAIGPGDCSQ